MSKGIDSVFLHYGVRKEDMELILQTCRDNDINEEWLKENILKPYNEARTQQNTVDERALMKIMKRAIKNVQP